MAERFSGLGTHIGNLSRLSGANALDQPGEFHGSQGRRRHGVGGHRRHPARGLGRGWKVSPSIRMEKGEKNALPTSRARARSSSSGSRRLTCAGAISSCASIGTAKSSLRSSARLAISSPAAGANMRRSARSPSASILGRAFNCYWEMPFRRSARITLENRDPDEHAIIYWQINYALTEVPEDAAYFHAQFRRKIRCRSNRITSFSTA